MNNPFVHGIISVFVMMMCLIVVIGIHELGHALAARFFRIDIHRISLGFGRTLKRWTTRSGSEIELNLCLIGGRLHLLNSRVAPVPEDKFMYCFDKKPIWIRTIVLLAGSITNLITAFLALFFMMLLGFKQIEPIIANVSPSSNAAIAGLKAGDRFTQIAKQDTPFWRDVGMQFMMNAGRNQVPVQTCSAANQCRISHINLKIRDTKSSNRSLFAALGITPATSPSPIIYIKGVSVGRALQSAGLQCGQLLWFFIIMIKQILTGNIPFAALLGPFKLFETIIDSFFQGLAIFLYFLANFSIAMALVNLLPLPSLDGGAIIYGLIEKIRGKPVSIAFELLLYRLCSIILVLMFIQLVLNDLRSYHLL